MNYNEKLLKAKAAIQSKQLNGLVPRGAWAEKNIYMPQDIVYFKGKTYICITSTQGTDPKKSKDFVPFAGNGKDGIDARNIEVGKNNTHIRWRYIDSTKWYDLVDLDSLVGEKGDQGEVGKTGAVGKAGENGKQVQIQVANEAIQWRYEGGTWINLIKISELVGPRGAKGEKGDPGLSAYEIWLESNVGSKKDFLESLRGPSGRAMLGRGGGGSTTGGVQSVVAGTNVTVDNTDPHNPVVSATGGSGSPGGSDTQVQFNDSGNFGGDSAFTYDKTNDVLKVHKVAGDATDGLIIEANNGTDIGILGAGNTANVTWYGSHNFDAATASRIAAFGASKTLEALSTATYPSLTELSYVKGVTSAVQTQIDSKLASSAYDDATDTETDTGTSTTKYVSPAGLKTAKAGTKPVSVYAIEALTAITTGDGKAYFRIPTALNGMNLVMVGAAVVTTSSSGNPTVQIARGRQANATSAHTFADMLSTRITIDATEYDSKDATTAPIIDTANDDVLTGDLIRVDVDVAGTGTKGLIVTMSFQIP